MSNLSFLAAAEQMICRTPPFAAFGVITMFRFWEKSDDVLMHKKLFLLFHLAI